MNDVPTPTEVACLEAMRRGDPPEADPTTSDGWLRFGLALMLEACRTIRVGWNETLAGAVIRKPDGTPGLELEQEVEAVIRRRMASFAPEVPIVGEEFGGELAQTGWTVAVDPIDGTWAFFNGTETACCSLGLFLNGDPVAGIVGNPATGEVAYGGRGIEPRLMRVSLFGERDTATDLPVVPDGRRAPTLVSVHPDRKQPSLLAHLVRAWSDGDIAAIRAPGGAPAWGIIDAAKGRYTYINPWTTRPAEPFDLAGAVEVMRAAGGDVDDLDGRPIDAARHVGAFVAGIEATARKHVASIARNIVV